MAFFIGILAALQIVGGVLIYLAAKSAIHEILAAVMFGMGVLAIGLSTLINRSDEQISAIKSCTTKTRLNLPDRHVRHS